MMKLVISFDEIGLDNGFSDFDPEKAEEKLIKFLENQFPEWDILPTFQIGAEYPFPPEYDFDNMEIHIQMNVVQLKTI